MNRLVFIVVGIIATLILAFNSVPAQAATQQEHVQPHRAFYSCETDNPEWSFCMNMAGRGARGYIGHCFYPSNVIIAIAYWGHEFISYTAPVPRTAHFYHHDWTPWGYALYDNLDQEHGWRVWWRIGGPKQDYLGQKHILYDVTVECEPHD